MAVTVLGGAGFIGSNLVDELLVQGFTVKVLDNFSEGKRENLPDRHPNLTVMRGDIREFTDVLQAVDGSDWVFHLAAMSRIQPSIVDPLLAVHQNMVGTANVLEACRKAGVKRVVYSASSSAYGRHGKDGFALHESLAPDCLNPYSLTKKAGEEMMLLYNDLYGISTVSLRYFNVYGPKHQETGDYATVIAIFMRQLREGRPMTVVGDGGQRRDFTFVGDVVRANIMAAMNMPVRGCTINIGTGENHSINDVARMVASMYKTEPVVEYLPERPAEARVTLADVNRAWDELGWKPQVRLEDGLKITKVFQDFISRHDSRIIRP